MFVCLNLNFLNPWMAQRRPETKNALTNTRAEPRFRPFLREKQGINSFICTDHLWGPGFVFIPYLLSPDSPRDTSSGFCPCGQPVALPLYFVNINLLYNKAFIPQKVINAGILAISTKMNLYSCRYNHAVFERAKFQGYGAPTAV